MKELVFLCIEDDQVFRELLELKVKEYMEQYHILVRFISYDQIPQNINFDLFDGCFLDVEIGEENTFAVMQKMRSLGFNMPIIVISNYEQYIFHSVKFRIFDFIRKAHFDEEIDRTLENLMNYILQLNVYVNVQYSRKTVKIYLKDIIYIHTNSHHIVIYLKNKKEIEIWKGYHEVFLESYPNLVRIHKSYVINIDYCVCIENNYAYLINNKKIKVSQRCYKNFMQAMARHNF